MRKLKVYLSLVAWLLPASRRKNRLLCFLGNDVDPDAQIRPNIVIGCGPFHIDGGAEISSFNLFKNMSRVEMGRNSFIGRFNQISASPSYQRLDGDAGTLVLGAGAGIVNRHYLDCSGQIRVGEMAMIAGIRTIFQSHELDLVENKATVGIIEIGSYSFTSTACVILKGAVLPPKSLLAAGSVLTRPKVGATLLPGVFGGTPAKWLRECPDGEWWRRTEVHTPVKWTDETNAV
jgi:acetyltransferase-like isoleucine patch superfamily enzyme